MQANRRTLIFPLLLVAVGSGWLLSALEVLPDVNWVWTFGLAAAGILPIVVGGIDKASVVVGPLFLAASGLSAMRQLGRIPLEIELPILVILTGLLVLLAHHPAFPAPKWLDVSASKRGGSSG
jgi:hypothetical protein